MTISSAKVTRDKTLFYYGRLISLQNSLSSNISWDLRLNSILKETLLSLSTY